MGLLKKLFSKSKVVERPRENLELPKITEQYLHFDFGKYTDGPIPGKGGEMFQASIYEGNNGNVNKSFELKKKAIKAGLEEPDISAAYKGLGMIHIRRKELFKAVECFLNCIILKKRVHDATWQSAMYLYYIYDELGRKSEASQLLNIANEANKFLGWAHDISLENDIRDLARKTYNN